MTRNSSEPSMSSVTSLRMKALSSTTSTDGCWLEDDTALPHRFDLDPSIAAMQEDAAPVTATDVLSRDADAVRRERRSRRDEIALADRRASLREQRREHARTAGELGDDVHIAGPERAHALEQERYRRLRELRAVLTI